MRVIQRIRVLPNLNCRLKLPRDMPSSAVPSALNLRRYLAEMLEHEQGNGGNWRKKLLKVYREREAVRDVVPPEWIELPLDKLLEQLRKHTVPGKKRVQ